MTTTVTTDSPSQDEPATSVVSANADTITALLPAIPVFESKAIRESKDDSPERVTRRRSSVSIIQALVNTSHLLSTNDARRRYWFDLSFEIKTKQTLFFFDIGN